MQEPVIALGKKTAVVLFNLGGPDCTEAVKPFLFNLFNDKNIIGLPQPFRYALARFISGRRAPKATAIYNEIGGKSPILENTEAQAAALEASLSGHGQVKVFIAMRYWHPMADETAKQVKAFAPDHIIMLPLYPHFSPATTGSSFTDWDRAAHAAGLTAPTTRICCYPRHEEFVKAHAQLVQTYYHEAARFGRPRVLFSAHGLPEKNIRKGDPYQSQVEATTEAVVKKLGIADLDYVNCYQSRVGPLKWIGPSTESEIMRAGYEKTPIILVPIAFVSEHSETLVELDIEYAEIAHENGADHYYRVPTLSVHAHYIAALSDMCLKLKQGTKLTPAVGETCCDTQWKQCPCRNEKQRIEASL